VVASTPTTRYQSIRGGTLSGMWNHGGSVFRRGVVDRTRYVDSGSCYDTIR